MRLHDPYVVLTRDAADKIATAPSGSGDLVLRHASSEDMYVVRSVETSKNVRVPVEVPKEYAALRWGDPLHSGQWVRASTPELPGLHLYMSRRPGAAMALTEFRSRAPSIDDPGNNVGVLVTYSPDLTEDLVEAGATAFTGWLISRDGVTPIPIATEPDVVGLGQLKDLWPLEQIGTNSVMVVGCGSIGSAAVEALAGYGIGRVELVDPDRFLWHNILRHSLGPESVGRYKVTALKDHVRSRWPSLDVQAHKLDIVTEAHHARPLIGNVDLVLCAADGIAPRRVVSHLARRAGKPAVLACVLEHGSIGEVIRLRPLPRAGCLLCLRDHLAQQGAMDAEADQELDYGTGLTHQPMTALPPDLRLVGTLAAKIAVANLLESEHGDHTQRIPNDHAIIGLHPTGGLQAPFNIDQAGAVRWHSIPQPRPSCPTCSAA